LYIIYIEQERTQWTEESTVSCRGEKSEQKEAQ